MDVEELVSSTRRKITRLREAAADEERFLADLQKRASVSSPNKDTPVPAAPATNGTPEPSEQTPVDERPASMSEKRRLALAIVQARPGTWTTRAMEEAFREHGIDPKIGTPVKNVLWNLAQAGQLVQSGHGAYAFPPPSEDGAGEPSTQEDQGQ
jgi:hypothetical protein